MNKVATLCYRLFLTVTFLSVVNSCKEEDTLPQPTITSITPASGITGTQVVISGSGFETTLDANTVKFNSKQAVVSSAKENELIVTVPQDAGTGKVTVETRGGTVDGPEFKYIIPPTIQSIEPTAAKHSTSVKIKGLNFNPSDLKVKINGTAIPVTSSSETEIAITIPKGIGSGKITIETSDGKFEGPLFTYVYNYTVSTFAGTGVSGYVDGAGKDAQFSYPSGITFDGQDNLYVCDRTNKCIRKITPDGQVTTFVEKGILDRGSFPNGISIDNKGDFYIAEPILIEKITSVREVTVIAGGAESMDADGTGTEAGFNFLSNLIVNKDGDLIVCDLFNYKLRKVTPLGVVTTIAGNGTSDFVESQGLNGIGGAWDVVQTTNGDYYFTSFAGHRIGKLSPSNKVTSFAGDGSAALKDGPAESASFNSPHGIAIIDNNDLIISDTGNNRIRLVSNGIVTTIAGNGTAGLVNGDGSSAQFNSPYDVAVNSKGEIFVSEREGRVIRKIVRE